MIFQRSDGYTVNKERPSFYDAGLGVFMGGEGEGGSGPVPALGILDRFSQQVQDRFGNDIETRV